MPGRVVHCRREKYDIYIGRPSKWGNPYSHLPQSRAEYRVATRMEAIERFRDYVLSDATLLAALGELKGKVLGCWCAPLPCHGDVLVEMVDALGG